MKRPTLSDAIEEELDRLEAEIELCARRCTHIDRSRVELLLAEFAALKERATMFIAPRRPSADGHARQPVVSSSADSRTVLLTDVVSAVFLHEGAGWRFARWELAATVTRREIVVTTPSAEDRTRSFATIEAAADHFRDLCLPVAETGT